ncbi:hypothetical protein H5410_017496 [Solanum commersonii]|uniref:Uncharacterized protein n=1 Tax=Solanum commersonii TaxID=4109 RepID=A0A9J5ZZL7_SOLCO|nr:hypothetical protein H5410_017496 [Solanum commersonii]
MDVWFLLAITKGQPLVTSWVGDWVSPVNKNKPIHHVITPHKTKDVTQRTNENDSPAASIEPPLGAKTSTT